MTDDYDLDFDTDCPFCGHSPTHYRRCVNIGCDDGFFDLNEDDPILFSPGETEVCTECWGTGVEHWCPECGKTIMPRHTVADYSLIEMSTP